MTMVSRAVPVTFVAVRSPPPWAETWIRPDDPATAPRRHRHGIRLPPCGRQL